VDYANTEAFVRDIRVPEKKDDAKDAVVVIYTLFPFGLLPEQVLIWFACL
jgi:hypothetical protein